MSESSNDDMPSPLRAPEAVALFNAVFTAELLVNACELVSHQPSGSSRKLWSGSMTRIVRRNERTALPPIRLSVDPSRYSEAGRGPLHTLPFTRDVVLSDGGVYDNLGLETVWKSYTTVLVSDGVGKTEAEPDPPVAVEHRSR